MVEIKQRWTDGSRREEIIRVRIGPKKDRSVIIVYLPQIAFSSDSAEIFASRQGVLDRAKEVCDHAYINQVSDSVNANGSFNYIPCYRSAKELCVYASQKFSPTTDREYGIVYRAVADFIFCSKTMTVKEVLPYIGSFRLRHAPS